MTTHSPHRTRTAATVLVVAWPFLAIVEGMISLTLSAYPGLMWGRIVGTTIVFAVPFLAGGLALGTVRDHPRAQPWIILVVATMEFGGLLALILLSAYRCWTPLCGE